MGFRRAGGIKFDVGPAGNIGTDLILVPADEFTVDAAGNIFLDSQTGIQLLARAGAVVIEGDGSSGAGIPSVNILAGGGKPLRLGTDGPGDIELRPLGGGILRAYTAGYRVLEESIFAAKGDLLVPSGAPPDTVGRLPIGANGTVLTADSAETRGMKWAAAGGGGGVVVDSKTTENEIVNTIAQSDLLNGEISIPAGAMGANKLMILVMSGDLLYNRNVADTIRLKCQIGGANQIDTGALALELPLSATRRQWTSTLLFQNLTNATQRTWWQFDLIRAAVALTVGSGVPPTSEQASLNFGRMVGAGAVDTTVAQTVAVTVQWGTADLANAIKLFSAYMFIL